MSGASDVLFPGSTQALAGGGALTRRLDPTLAYATDLLSNLASETPSHFLILHSTSGQEEKKKNPYVSTLFSVGFPWGPTRGTD